MKPEGRRRTTAEDLADIVADDASNCVTCSDYAMDCIEGIQLTIFVELANINEVRHGHSAREDHGSISLSSSLPTAPTKDTACVAARLNC